MLIESLECCIDELKFFDLIWFKFVLFVEGEKVEFEVVVNILMEFWECVGELLEATVVWDRNLLMFYWELGVIVEELVEEFVVCGVNVGIFIVIYMGWLIDLLIVLFVVF